LSSPNEAVINVGVQPRFLIRNGSANHSTPS